MDELEAQRRKAELLAAYRKCFDSPEGKLVLRDLLDESGMLSASFAEHGLTDGMSVALRAARSDGKRALVRYILSKRETPVDEVFDHLEEMIRHAQNQRRSDGTGTLDWTDG